MKFSSRLLIFSLGFFCIGAQTLLIREFITSFVSNDLAVAVFFASWFCWIALAAWLVGKSRFLLTWLAKHLILLLLFYLPAFLLQYGLIFQVRKLAGVEAYALFPLLRMLGWALVVNALAGIITGMLFPAACEWFRDRDGGPVSLVYILEALGSLAGGVVITLLLACQVNPMLILLVFFLLLSGPVVLANFAGKNRWRYLAAILPVLLLLAGALRLDRSLMEEIYRLKWVKLLPAENYVGAFQTSQAEYLYGKSGEQWQILRGGGVNEVLPDRESGALTAAVLLCQHPRARQVLVVGGNQNLCRELLRIPQLTGISWAYFDRDYYPRLEKLLPENLSLKDPRLTRLTEDVRIHLAEKKGSYDLVYIDIPLADSAIGNRYFTREFYCLVNQNLAAGGVLGVRLTGGENVIGRETALLGASISRTLRLVFRWQIIKAGEDTWLIASDNSGISGDPDLLEKRFAGLPGAAGIFPPPAIHMLYQPDRERFARQKYDEIQTPGFFLINRDRKPLPIFSA